MEIKIFNDNSNNGTKLGRTIEHYLQEHFGNLKIDINSRIIIIDIYLQFVEENGRRAEYRPFIQSSKGLTDTKINNPASFLAFCNIHGFFPVINNLYIKNGSNTINIADYKEFIFLIRIFHLFFYKGYDYVLYDTIKHYLKKHEILAFFEKNNIILPTESELFTLLKLFEDIKKSSFDIPKHNLNNGLQKITNIGTYSENIFLEIAMKYENIVRKLMGFESTYIKSASFDDDTRKKTDFDLIYLPNKEGGKHNSIPIQFTRVSEKFDKFRSFEEFFEKNNINSFLYIQTDGDFKNKAQDIELNYKYWLEQPERRENQDPNSFPFFINKLKTKKIKDLIILYFSMHQILKNKTDPGKLDFTVENVGFRNILINTEVKHKNIQLAYKEGKPAHIRRYKYSIHCQDKYIGTIYLLEKTEDLKNGQKN